MASETFKRCSDGTGDQEPRGCLFIHGDVKEGGWRYCQAPRRDGSTYCEEHHALTHLKTSGDGFAALAKLLRMCR